MVANEAYFQFGDDDKMNCILLRSSKENMSVENT